MIIKIYAGLSLTADDIRDHLPDAVVCPPVRRGDIAADLAAGVNVIGIVDGEFFQNFAVTPSEILSALRVGVKIYGASSMGALRAAELDGFGMIGCGVIYQHICDQPYFCDDHLGLIFSGDNHGDNPGEALMPMVDFTATLHALQESKRLSASLATQLRQHYQDLHFSDRNLNRLAQVIAEAEADQELIAAWALVRDNAVNQKRNDGLQLVQRISNDMAEVARVNALLNA